MHKPEGDTMASKKAAKNSAAGGPVERIVEQWHTERPDLDASPIAVFGRVHRVYLRYQAEISKVFGNYDLNSASFDVLAALRRSGKPFRKMGSDLANDSLLSSAGVTFRLDRLENAGLIERHRDTEDRRVVYSQLTEDGLAVIEKAIADHLENEERMLHGLTKQDRADLARLLAKLETSIIEAASNDG